MGIIKRGSIGSAIAFAVVAGIATAPAHAQPSAFVSSDGPEAVNTAPPAEPEETDLVDDPEPEPEETRRVGHRVARALLVLDDSPPQCGEPIQFLHSVPPCPGTSP
ncbi:hypothetical protein [Streptomyces sp. NPDC057909]|uniref:hypothetical protein n=1 Tax=Streptomyces sp. NPDC057909 TaxID=3346277 RepID=UPI0036E949CB